MVHPEAEQANGSGLEGEPPGEPGVTGLRGRKVTHGDPMTGNPGSGEDERLGAAFDPPTARRAAVFEG
ncbi:hypothetical protein P12x_005149 [Tundrisphaera lichenicola]|uniref:hypothetical protein n=1 Tax=Tundrisphaera lichenicola TaxID=2029860 RepID=UPI003EB77C20